MDPALPTMFLTAAERERFAVYLEMEAKSDEERARQVEALGPAHAPMVKKMRAESMAAAGYSIPALYRAVAYLLQEQMPQ